MSSTTREICETYARFQNLEEPPEAFFELLHPDVKWITKWRNFHSRVAVEYHLDSIVAGKWQDGLKHVNLVSGYTLEDDRYIDCVVDVTVSDQTQYWTRTTFQTDGNQITGMSTYVGWMNPRWPHPERARKKLAQLRASGIPIAPISEPPQKLIWPDDPA